MTWYKSDADLPPLEDYDLINHPRTYRYFDKPVLYPFGFGLSYTAFDYKHLCVEKYSCGGLKVSVDVTNTGAVCGDEVAQLYIRRVSASKTVHPLRRLIGFERFMTLCPARRKRPNLSLIRAIWKSTRRMKERRSLSRASTWYTPAETVWMREL